jgi:hypothetical protein
MSETTSHLFHRIAALGLSWDDQETLLASPLGDATLDYNRFMFQLCGVASAYPTYPFGTSFPLGTKYGDALDAATHATAVTLSIDLYGNAVAEGVPGDVVEFGVAAGGWLSVLLDAMETSGQTRRAWGFDSFEGLPEPDPALDSHGWTRGQFANAQDTVSATLRASERPHLQLVKGWFSDTLPQPAPQSIRQIAYAKIDCDLYGPALECLRFLKGRLSNGTVLMFDEWTHSLHSGETRAFAEWVPEVPEYRFDLVGFINFRLFFRVWHRAG